jgi:prepilin-type N-terminal cleavage/methylation domain-containing protein
MKSCRPNAAFTLIELLMVITIIALLAALAAPTIRNFRKGDATLASTHQLLDAVARARQLAISQRTTVYLGFVPKYFWTDPAYMNPMLTQADKIAATNLADKQLTAYNFVSLRSVGDQPGQNTPRYLSAWQTLPESTLIAPEKFNLARSSSFLVMTNPPSSGGYTVYGFDVATNIPFPLETTVPYTTTDPYPALPYIAFDYLGRLVSGQDEFIPVAQGGVSITRDQNRAPILGLPPNTVSVLESPPGNSTNTYNLIHIDWLTGRGRLEHQEVQ